MLQQQAAYENARLRYVMSRLKCGCLGEDCVLHGAYVPEDIDLYRRAASNCHRPPDVAELLPNTQNVYDKFSQLSVDDTMVAQMITAHRQGAFASWDQMLMALVCLKTQLASDLMSQVLGKAREAPSLSSFPVVDSQAEETFNLIEDLLHSLREEAVVSWQALDVPGSPAAAAISWLIKHASDGRVGCTWLEAYIASRPSPEERRPQPSLTEDDSDAELDDFCSG
jgi:hypothetical protein